MSDISSNAETGLEVVAPDGSRRFTTIGTHQGTPSGATRVKEKIAASATGSSSTVKKSPAACLKTAT